MEKSDKLYRIKPPKWKTNVDGWFLDTPVGFFQVYADTFKVKIDSNEPHGFHGSEYVAKRCCETVYYRRIKQVLTEVKCLPK